MARPATLRDRSSSVTAPDFLMSSSDCALIENGTSTMAASRLVAVTVMLSSFVVAPGSGEAWARTGSAWNAASNARTRIRGRGFATHLRWRACMGDFSRGYGLLVRRAHVTPVKLRPMKAMHLQGGSLRVPITPLHMGPGLVFK